MEQTHRGVRPAGLGSPPADRRVAALDDGLAVLETIVGRGHAADPHRAAAALVGDPAAAGHFSFGTVVHAVPHLNWYKVQAADGLGFVAACKPEDAGLLPPGVRPTGTLPPNSRVWLYRPPGLGHCYIVGVVPPNLDSGAVYAPDWVTQAGGSGLRREEAHSFPVTGMYRSGGVVDFSAGRPADETSFMKGLSASTGVALHVDDFQAYLRVDEACGLFLSLFDSHARLAGDHLRVESAVHAEEACDDEGESRYFRGVAAYPHEALGVRVPGTPFLETASDADAQYRSDKAKVDLADPSLSPIFRTKEYGGYVGQGRLLEVSVPGDYPLNVTPDGVPPDRTVFRESVASDGSAAVVSAKRLYMGKRSALASPMLRRHPEDGAGDDAAAGGYRHSGSFGSGPPHLLRDFACGGPNRPLTQCGAVLDMLAYLTNWQPLAPFHYHEKDFRTPQESELGAPRVADRLDFSPLAGGGPLADPEPVSLTIDPRYGDVSYFARESFIIWHDDGSVQIGCGFGNHVRMSQDGVTIETPGQLKLLAGTDLVVLSAQTCMRSHGSTDISSAKKDVRIKADVNLHVLAGNSGSGSVLVESLGRGVDQKFDGVFGEDVEASGVVVRARESGVALVGSDVYLRTGGPGVGDGDIVLDASKGRRRVSLYGREIDLYAASAVQFVYGPSLEDSTVDAVYYFGRTTTIFDTQLFLKGKLLGYGDAAGVVVNGGVYATKTIATTGRVADKSGGMIGKVPQNYGDEIRKYYADVDSTLDTLRAAAGDRHRVGVVERYYAENRVGNDDVLAAMHFTFRDPPGPPRQYGCVELVFHEPRWQTILRQGGAVGGGFPWDEPPVVSAGERTYPWPGRQKWAEESVFVRPAAAALFDPAAGTSADRGGVYESFSVDAPGRVPMAAGVQINRR